jgi:hypothetical protein
MGKKNYFTAETRDMRKNRFSQKSALASIDFIEADFGIFIIFEFFLMTAEPAEEKISHHEDREACPEPSRREHEVRNWNLTISESFVSFVRFVVQHPNSYLPQKLRVRFRKVELGMSNYSNSASSAP